MTSKGSLNGQLDRAIAAGNLTNVRALAAAVESVPLGTALRICLLIGDQEPARYTAAAKRWLGRVALESRRAELVDLVELGVALEQLPRRSEVSIRTLDLICERVGIPVRLNPSSGREARRAA